MESPQNRMHPLEAYWLPSAPEAFWHLDHVDRERARTKNHDVNSCSTRVHGGVFWAMFASTTGVWWMCIPFFLYWAGFSQAAGIFQFTNQGYQQLTNLDADQVCESVQNGGSSLGPPCFLIVDANGEPASAGLGGCPLPSSQRQRCLVLMPPTRPARTESGSAR
jgi:hypothetical protein